MLLNDQQAIVLLQILKDSLPHEFGSAFDREFRSKLYEVLLGQQSDELIDLKK